MEPEIERTIRAAYAAFAGGEVERLLGFFEPDALYVNPPYAIEDGTRRGHDALIEIWQGLHSTFEFDSVDIGEVTQGPHGVLVTVRYHGRGRGSGAPVDVPMAHVLQIGGDRRVAQLAWFGTRAEAAVAAGV